MNWDLASHTGAEPSWSQAGSQGPEHQNQTITKRGQSQELTGRAKSEIRKLEEENMFGTCILSTSQDFNTHRSLRPHWVFGN